MCTTCAALYMAWGEGTKRGMHMRLDRACHHVPICGCIIAALWLAGSSSLRIHMAHLQLHTAGTGQRLESILGHLHAC